MCTSFFLKQILKRAKYAFHNTEVTKANVPQYCELKVSHLIEYAKKSPEVLKYLPDDDCLDPKRLPREFLTSIINTVDPIFFINAIEEAEKRR